MELETAEFAQLQQSLELFLADVKAEDPEAFQKIASAAGLSPRMLRRWRTGVPGGHKAIFSLGVWLASRLDRLDDHPEIRELAEAFQNLFKASKDFGNMNWRNEKRGSPTDAGEKAKGHSWMKREIPDIYGIFSGIWQCSCEKTLQEWAEYRLHGNASKPRDGVRAGQLTAVAVEAIAASVTKSRKWLSFVDLFYIPAPRTYKRALERRRAAEEVAWDLTKNYKYLSEAAPFYLTALDPFVSYVPRADRDGGLPALMAVVRMAKELPKAFEEYQYLMLKSGQRRWLSILSWPGSPAEKSLIKVIEALPWASTVN
jgi:hypothetical protein